MKSFDKVLIATGNKGKFVEIEALLKNIGIKSVGIWEFDNLEEPDENGDSFAKNSLIKAKYYATKTGLVALADDSGICIDDLNGQPGIHSARFAVDVNTNKTDFDYAFRKIFNNLKARNVDLISRPKAHFICNLTIFDPKNDFHINFEGRVDGYLIYPPRGEMGFGYDPIFIKDGMEKTFGEIDRFEKDKISHRGDAFVKLVNYFQG
ncbi:MAG: RdgB/HAM1 family non-canonical purine NTP pyrophosphatase [Rickettsiales bacterium]|nr:RdgB/HAM1 family non-canonical purine NTP pyrophosphatase [Rickettsiales bacterium]